MAEVSSSRHNTLVERITKVLGNGEGTFGYGQGFGYGASPSSFEVSNSVTSNNNIVTAESINTLYTDMVRARLHQIGTEPEEIAEIIVNANIIAESESFIVDDRGISVIDENGDRKGILDFENLMQSIENDRFLLAPSQASVELAISSVRTSAWNDILTHEFEIEFSSYDHRRHFFNSGGEIRISAGISFPNTDKGQSWSQFLNSFGFILFNHNSTRSSITGLGTTKGNYQLNSSYQTVFIATGTGFTNSVYNGNEYKIEARAVDYVSPTDPGRILRFRITLNDKAVDNQIDNIVDGTVKSNVEIFKADSDAVRVNTPQLSNIILLTDADIPALAPPPPPPSTPPPPPPPSIFSFTVSPSSYTDSITYGDTSTQTLSLTGIGPGSSTVTVQFTSSLRAWETNVNGSVPGVDISLAAGETKTVSLNVVSDGGDEGFTGFGETFTRTGTVTWVALETSASSYSSGVNSHRITGEITVSPESVPIPTYSISPSSATLVDGSSDSVTYTVTTTNVPDGTRLYTFYDNGDRQVADNFLISNGEGTFTISGTDFYVEPSTYTIFLKTNNSISGTTVATATLTVTA